MRIKGRHGGWRRCGGAPRARASDPQRPAATNNGVAQLVQVLTRKPRQPRRVAPARSAAITNAHFELASELQDWVNRTPTDKDGRRCISCLDPSATD
jgi:hypothetical protein